MKLVRINRHQVGLMFRGRSYEGIRLEGWHLVGWGLQLKTYEQIGDFRAPVDLSILLEDENFRAVVHLVEVQEHELCLEYREGIFQKVLTPGRYVYWKSKVNYDFRMINTRNDAVENVVAPEIMERAEILRHVYRYDVGTKQVGLLIVDGELERKLKAGRYYFWRTNKNLQVLVADLRAQNLEVAGQEILTKDRVGLRMNFHLQYRITDVERALLENQQMTKQLYLLVQLALREYVGTRTLDELLAGKEAVHEHVSKALETEAVRLGVTVLSGGLRDIILPGEIREIMNRVLVAEKQAQANTILRRDEAAATRSLLNAAKLMEDNAMLLRLKEMEYVEKIAEKINTLSVTGGGQVIDQLRALFVADKK